MVDLRINELLMNLQDAKKLQQSLLNKINSEDPDTGFIIMDVVVEPLNGLNEFRSNYIKYKRSEAGVTNEALLKQFPSDKFQVSFALSYDGEWVTIAYDDAK